MSKFFESFLVAKGLKPRKVKCHICGKSCTPSRHLELARIQHPEIQAICLPCHTARKKGKDAKV